MSEVKSNEIIIPRVKRETKKVDYTAVSPKDIIKKHIEYAIIRDGGKYVNFDGEIGILIAGVENKVTNELGFLYVNKDRNIDFVKSDVRYKLSKIIPASCSVLDYIYSHSSVDLNNRISAQIDNSEYILFTDNKLKVYKQKTPKAIKVTKTRNKKTTKDKK